MKKIAIVCLFVSLFALSISSSVTAESQKKDNQNFSSCTYVLNGIRPFLSSGTLGYGSDFRISKLSCDGKQIEIISQTISKEKDSVLIKTRDYGNFKLMPDPNNTMSNILEHNGIRTR